MVTRGIIKKREEKKENNTSRWLYRVWIPFLDGNEQIEHEAVYMTLPHEQTVLNIGDVVYVAAVDIDFEDFVILGLVNNDSWETDGAQGTVRIRTSQTNYSTFETSTGLQISNVLNLSFADKGKFQAPAETTLPRKISISLDNKTEQLNLHSLTGMEQHGVNATLGNVMWKPENGGLGFDYTLPDYRRQDQAQLKQNFRSNMGVLKTVIISQDDFDNLINSAQGLEKNTVYYVFDGDD